MSALAQSGHFAAQSGTNPAAQRRSQSSRRTGPDVVMHIAMHITVRGSRKQDGTQYWGPVLGTSIGDMPEDGTWGPWRSAYRWSAGEWSLRPPLLKAIRAGPLLKMLHFCEAEPARPHK